MLAKTIHRWVGTGAMLFVAYLVVTGSIIAVNEFVNPAVFGSGGGQGGVVRGDAQRAADRPIPSPEHVERMTATALRAAADLLPDAPLTGAEIRLYERDGKALADVALGSGQHAERITIDAISGARVKGAAEAQAAARLNTLLQRFHSGAIGGLAGKLLILATGLSLLTLCVTGIWLYLDMARRRWAMGRREVFWG
ncbi:MAG: PepSY-associated TM helix domain-containing protein [Caulobacter sp.]